MNTAPKSSQGTILKGKVFFQPSFLKGKLLVYFRGSKFEFLSVEVMYPIGWEFPSKKCTAYYILAIPVGKWLGYVRITPMHKP